MGTSRAARSPRSTSSTCATGPRAPAGTAARPLPPSPTTSSRARARSTCRPTSSLPASPSTVGSRARAHAREGTRADPAQGRDPRPPGSGGAARPARPGVRGGPRRAGRAAGRARGRRPRPPARDVRDAAHQSAHRGLRDPVLAQAGPTPTTAIVGGMRFGVVRFPGSCDERDAQLAAARVGEAKLLWHADPDLHGVDAVIVPGGFSYGDYLRVGAIARFSPVMESVIAFARDGGPVLGICNGFQVLCEAGLLPGALLPNVGLRFVCRQVGVEVVDDDTPFTRACEVGDSLSIPVKHTTGRYYAPPGTLPDDRVVLRYAPGHN